MGDNDKTELRMNLAAVKKYDPYAKDIIETSSHVAFYTFNSDGNNWEKTNVEGAFFVYSRTAEPWHSIFVNNRLNTCNLVEPITSEIEIQPQPPFLLYRNERTKIRGFWFYDKQECDRVADLISKLVENCKRNKEMEKLKPTPNNGVDIFSMLTKAQQDFNNAMTTTTSGQSISSNKINDSLINNNQSDVTSSVMNFFAAAKPNPPEIPRFQRMLSNPLSVEQIEKQQRTTTPDKKSSPIQHKNVMPIPLQQIQQTQSQKNIQLSNLINTAPPPPPLSSSNTSSIQSGVNIINNLPMSKNLDQIENGLKLMRVNSPNNSQTELGSSPLANFLNSSNLTVISANRSLNQAPINATDLSNLESSQKSITLLRKQSEPIMTATSPGKPALLLPTMFVSPSTSNISGIQSLNNSLTPTINNPLKEKNSSNNKILNNNNNNNNVPLNNSSIPSSSENNIFSDLNKPEPLTQSQLLQAMSYLIKNDPEFIKKLHEAYLKSFTEMVSL